MCDKRMWLSVKEYAQPSALEKLAEMGIQLFHKMLEMGLLGEDSLVY